MVTIGSTMRVRIPVGEEAVTLVCRRPQAQELSRFLGERFETKRNKVKSRLIEARVALIDKILVDVEGAQYVGEDGETRALCASTALSIGDQRHWTTVLGKTVNAWKDLIPDSWKSSAAMRFEDAAPEDEETSTGN
jgi:hypothetical protein